MTDANPKETPERGVSQVSGASNDSGYYSVPPSPAGMLHVSSVFKGVCKKKVHENFGYLKVKVYPIRAIEEIQITHDNLFTEQSLEELKESKRFKVADKLIKQLIRKGEAHCKTFLQSFHSETIQSSYVLEYLHQQADKTVPENTEFNVNLRNVSDYRSRICEELENDRVLDPLLEFYILSIDDHDRVVYNHKTRIDKNNCVLDALYSKASGDWIPGFVYILKTNGHKLLLEEIQSAETPVVSEFRPQLISDSTFEMSIRVNGINSKKIEWTLAWYSEIDELCKRFAKLEISNIRHGSVLLMVHPIVPDTWRKSTEDGKETLLQDFIRELMDKPDIKALIQREVTVTIDVQEIKNVFGDPAWRVKQGTNLPPDQQCLNDNWTYLTEELEVDRLMEIMGKDMEESERDKITRTEGRRERVHAFLNLFMKNPPSLNFETLIDSLEKTGQLQVVKRLKGNRICHECLIETYKYASNYTIIIEEMVSSIMTKTVAKFENIPHLIRKILTPDCGKSRRDRAQLFMQYVLLNEEVLMSFENTLATIEFVPLEPKQCTHCQPGGFAASLNSTLGLVEDTDSIHCVLNVTKEHDSSLRIELAKSVKGETKEDPVIIRKDEEEKPHESVPPKVLKRPLEVPPAAEGWEGKEKARSISRISSQSYLRTSKDFPPTVVAIDFGTTYSGFAFSLKKENSQIFTKKWTNASGKGLESDKTPTSLLLNHKKEFVAFGYDAEDKYEQFCHTDEHSNFYYFRHFKMRLHSSASLKRTTMIEDILGKTMPALDVFAVAIKYLKSEAEKALMEQGYNKYNISWVITVPAIWDDSAKQFMREAAEQAFISTKKLTIALEPEVASVYINSQTMEKYMSESHQKLIKSSLGTKFMVVDVGGGTSDITVMEIAEDNKLKQISISSGGPCGGESINNQILSKIESLVGTDVNDLFRQSSTYEYNQLIGDIEFAKRAWSKGKKFKLQLPECLIKLYESMTGKSLMEQTGSSEGISMKKNRLVFSPELTDKMIQTVIHEIIKHAKNSHKQSEDISHIVIVGGFADNAVLKEELEKQFSAFKVIIPAEPGLAVLKGAVLYGHDPSCVSMRRCDRTYGTQVYRVYKDTDPADKMFTSDGSHYCKDVFNRLVEIGENIEINETRRAEITPIRSGMPTMSVKIYGSTDPEPSYVTDESCTYLGKIDVNIPEDRRTLEETVFISMTFGQTEILVEGKSEHSKEVVETKIDFLSKK